MKRLLIVVALVGFAAPVSAQRDSRAAPGTGTATMSGIVLLDGDTPQPVRRARVALSSADRAVGRTVITDDSGTFTFRALPAGRYSLSATKEAYVSMQYGARSYGRPGTPIVLADGERLSKLTLRMSRGSVITGMR